MRQKDKETVQEITQKEEQCHHFWVIEVPNGPQSGGTCKYCGKNKEFLNAFPVFNPLKKNANPLELPKLPEVEMDKDSKS